MTTSPTAYFMLNDTEEINADTMFMFRSETFGSISFQVTEGKPVLHSVVDNSQKEYIVDDFKPYHTELANNLYNYYIKPLSI